MNALIWLGTSQEIEYTMKLQDKNYQRLEYRFLFLRLVTKHSLLEVQSR
jgi:hypothetical protein